MEFSTLREETEDNMKIILEPLLSEHFPWSFSEMDSISGMELDIIRKRQSDMISNLQKAEDHYPSSAKKLKKIV